jgi:hypothetical protein
MAFRLKNDVITDIYGHYVVFCVVGPLRTRHGMNSTYGWGVQGDCKDSEYVVTCIREWVVLLCKI